MFLPRNFFEFFTRDARKFRYVFNVTNSVWKVKESREKQNNLIIKRKNKEWRDERMFVAFCLVFFSFSFFFFLFDSEYTMKLFDLFKNIIRSIRHGGWYF